MRIRLDLAYDGAGFSGWAKQPGRRTVQGDLEAALAQVLRIPEARVVVAGRTDTGVHALRQVCHTDVAAWPGETQRRLNAVLADDVRVRAAGPAPDGFDARFSALSRHYVYLVSDSGLLDPRARGSVWIRRRQLATDTMHNAAQHLVGEHDFAAFCKARPEASSVRTVLELGVERRADPRDPQLIEIAIRADAFCHSMVRSIVGALLAVGEGRLDAEALAQILHAAQRVPKFATAPAHGLALVDIAYPPDDELAVQAQRARRFRGRST